MDGTTALGLFAGLLTTIAYLPQLIKTWKTKSADDISWTMLITLCVGIILWLVYASFVHDIPLIAANVVTLVLSSSILILKIRFKGALPDGASDAPPVGYSSPQMVNEDMPLGSPELID